jgi:class 3 adenylate cyclase
VVDQLIADPSSVQVSGSKRDATFIFTDIAGFTTLSEKLEAEELSEVLNEYLDGACEIILKYTGTIDKFIGDAIMAIFNAPIPQADHAERGIRCALELDAYAEAFRKDCNARDIPLGVTRIGIHSGLSIIGNFGSKSRMDFTALGDTVNTAARTEGVNKYFGTRVCCTQQVVDQCPDLEFRPIGDIVLKGKVEATRLYTPVAATDAPELIAGYRRAYTLLEASDPNAVDCLASLSKDFPEDPVIRFHQDRIALGLLSSRVVMDDK